VVHIDINEQIQAFAKSKRIKPEDFPAFRDKILNGLRTLKLRTDTIELEKYKAIANRKDAQLLAKQQGVDTNGTGKDKEADNQ
jgi:hypothetical protein